MEGLMCRATHRWLIHFPDLRLGGCSGASFPCSIFSTLSSCCQHALCFQKLGLKFQDPQLGMWLSSCLSLADVPAHPLPCSIFSTSSSYVMSVGESAPLLSDLV